MKDFFQLMQDWFPVLKTYPHAVLGASIVVAALVALYKAKDLRAKVCKPLHSKLCDKIFQTQRWLFMSKSSQMVNDWKYYTSESKGKVGDDITWTLVSWPRLKPVDRFVMHGAVGMESALYESQAKLQARWQIDHNPDGLGIGPVPARGIRSKLRRATAKIVHVLGTI